MKKTKKALLIILPMLFSAFFFSGCSFSFLEDDYLEQLACEHQYDEGIITKVSTCAKEGELTKTCKKCGKEKTKSIAKQAHSYFTVPEQAPTCTGNGYSAHEVCSVCDSVKGKTIIYATGHTVVEVPEESPTCTQVGYTAYSYCSVCYTYLEEKTTVSALGHTEMVTPGKPATCTQAGYTAYSCCSICDEVLLESTVIQAGAHDYRVPGAYYTTDNCGICGSSNNFSSEIQAGHYAYTAYTGQDLMGKMIRVKWYDDGVQNVLLQSDVSDNAGFILEPGHEYSIYNYGLLYDGKVGSKVRACIQSDIKSTVVGCLEAHSTNMTSVQIGDYVYFKFPAIMEFTQAFDYWGEITFLSNAVVAEKDWGKVEIVSELLSVETGNVDLASALTNNGNGTYSYTFSGVGDFVHNDEVTLDIGDALVCDFSITIDSLDKDGWFGTCFGDEKYKESGLVSYPHNQYWMINYDGFGGRLWCGGSVPVLTKDELKEANVILTGVTYNYRIALTKDSDGTYTYQLFRKASTESEYTLIHENEDIACPTPSCLMLTSVFNTFTLTDLCFYKV